MNDPRPIDRTDAADEPGIFDTVDPAAVAAADARGIAHLEAGRTISNEAVIRWLRSWGTDNPLPRPQCGE